MQEMTPDNKYTPAQIWIRGFVYLAISMTTELLSIMTGAFIDIRIAGVKLFLAGLITLRAYMDKTPSHGEGNNDGNNGITTQS